MTAPRSFDHLLDELRTTGHCRVVLRGDEAERFQRCCARFDRAAVRMQRGGMLGGLVGLVVMPVVFAANKRTIRANERLAGAVDLYAVVRHELTSVTGQRQADDTVSVTFST